VIKQIGSTSIAQDAVSIIGKLENTIAQNPIADRTIVQFDRQTVATGSEHMDNVFNAVKEKTVLKIMHHKNRFTIKTGFSVFLQIDSEMILCVKRYKKLYLPGKARIS
jgi:hypothetical protein